jgi:hypothetical protein
VRHRFWATLSLEELETFTAGGDLPDPVSNRPSNLDTMDQRSLIKLWEEQERVFRDRSQADQDSYANTGIWPEQRGRLHYSIRDGKLFVEWQESQEQAARQRKLLGEHETSGLINLGESNVRAK